MSNSPHMALMFSQFCLWIKITVHQNPFKPINRMINCESPCFFSILWSSFLACTSRSRAQTQLIAHSAWKPLMSRSMMLEEQLFLFRVNFPFELLARFLALLAVPFEVRRSLPQGSLRFESECGFVLTLA